MWGNKPREQRGLKSEHRTPGSGSGRGKEEEEEGSGGSASFVLDRLASDSISVAISLNPIFPRPILYVVPLYNCCSVRQTLNARIVRKEKKCCFFLFFFADKNTFQKKIKKLSGRPHFFFKTLFFQLCGCGSWCPVGWRRR